MFKLILELCSPVRGVCDHGVLGGYECRDVWYAFVSCLFLCGGVCVRVRMVFSRAWVSLFLCCWCCENLVRLGCGGVCVQGCS